MSENKEKRENWTVVLIENEFAKMFPEIDKMDLNKSDKIRVALGLEPRQKSAGAPITNNSKLAEYNRRKQQEYRSNKKINE